MYYTAETLAGSNSKLLEFPNFPNACEELLEKSKETIVLFTDPQSTRAALKTSALTVRNPEDRVRLIVLEEIPYSLPLNAPKISNAFIKQKFQSLASGVLVDTNVDIYFCRNKLETLQRVLKAPSLIFLGIRRWSWPWHERRLIQCLRKNGHQVMVLACP